MYNLSMKEIIQQRIVALSKEIEALHNEREAMFQRDKEIDVRLHQLVGAIYEMQQLIADLDRQPLEEKTSAVEEPHQSTLLSEGVDLSTPLGRPTEIGKNNLQQS